MSSSPGTVRCTSQKRNSPSHGKCGLATSTPPWPPSTRSLPTAQPLLAIGVGANSGAENDAGCAPSVGGFAVAMYCAKREPDAFNAMERA